MNEFDGTGRQDRSVPLPYGRGTLRLALPSRPGVRVLKSREVGSLPDPVAALASSLLSPIASPSLIDLAKGKHSACIVVSDASRPVPNGLLLPPLLQTLAGAGIPTGRVTLLIANGLHEPVSETGFAALLGAAASMGARIVNHDCRDGRVLRRVCDLCGTPIEINSHFLDADLKILTGLIEPHGLAGFSGGGKSVIPGIAGFGAMKLMHSYALIKDLGDAVGKLDGNLFRRHVDTVCDAVGVDFTVNVLQNRRREVTAIFAGAPGETFLAGAKAAAGEQILMLSEPAGAVITTGGGDPLDRSFYQACKGLVTASPMVAEGGTLLIAAECGEGLGSPGFCEVARSTRSAAAFAKKYCDPANFTTDQWAAQVLHHSLARAGRVMVFSGGLDQQDAEALGLVKVEDFEAAARSVLAENETVYVVPEGPYLTASLSDADASGERHALIS